MSTKTIYLIYINQKMNGALYVKRLVGFVVFVSMTSLAFSQDLAIPSMDTLAVDTLLQDSIKEPPPYYGALIVSAEVCFAPHYNGYNTATSIGLGLQYNRWIAGFSVFDFSGSIDELLIFPNAFELDYRYGGPTIGFEVFDSEWISGDVMASGYFGDMIWRNKQSGENLLRDKISVMAVSAKVDLDRFRYIKPYCRFGYQKMYDLDLELVKTSDFTGFIFVFGLQIGFFNQ